MRKSIDGWEGAFSLYQNRNFTEPIARHHKLKLLDLDGLLIMQKRLPVIGSMGCMLGGPERKESFQQWRSKFDDQRFAYIRIQTNEKLHPLKNSCISAVDNANMLVWLPTHQKGFSQPFNKQPSAMYQIGDQSPTKVPGIKIHKIRFGAKSIPCYEYRVIRSRSKHLLSSLKNRSF